MPKNNVQSLLPWLGTLGYITPAIDAAKIETELGWRARESFETGIEKTIAWYLKSGDW